MHAINAELIWIFISAIVLVRFWRIVLILFLCVMVAMVLLGLATALSYIGH